MNNEKQNRKEIVNKNYYKEVSKFDTLTSKEIKDLYILINQGDVQAKNKIITSNLKLVIHFAKQYRAILTKTQSIELDDLISEGNIGLIKAIEKFNPKLNIKFSYYASFWIKKYIVDSIMNQGDMIRTPQNQILAYNKIGNAVDELFQKNQYEVFQSDVEELNKFTEAEINHFFFTKPYVNRIEENDDFKEDDGEDNDNKERVKYNMKYLNQQERNIIKMLYGYNIDESEILTVQELSDNLGLTRQRINEIKLNAITKLKKRMNQ